MKLFVEKMVIGDGLNRFKAHAVNDAMTTIEPDYTDVKVFTTRNPEGSDSPRDTNNTLYDVDSVEMSYFSAPNEDNSFRVPPIRHQDIMQFNEYGFAVTEEVSGQLSLPLDKFKFTDRYTDMNNVLISYDGTNFGDVNITDGMSESEIVNELMKVFGSANPTGADADFIDKMITELHPSISVSAEAGSLPFSYVLETDLTRMQNVEPYGSLEINLFKTKNHLKNDSNVYIDDSDRLVAWRRYKSIGTNYENIWMSYCVDFADATTNEHLTAGYETVEHVSGFSKYKSEDSLHKSNIYSIRIHNSGLSAEGAIYEEIRNIFEKAVFNLMTKIAPAHCQLWKIEYIDE
jgi:hypothetical protein